MLTASVWCIFGLPTGCIALHLIKLKMHLRKYCCLNHPSWPTPGNTEQNIGNLELKTATPSLNITTEQQIEAVNPVSEAYGQWSVMVYHRSHEYTRYLAPSPGLALTNFMASSFCLTLGFRAWHWGWRWWSISTDQGNKRFVDFETNVFSYLMIHETNHKFSLLKC